MSQLPAFLLTLAALLLLGAFRRARARRARRPPRVERVECAKCEEGGWEEEDLNGFGWCPPCAYEALLEGEGDSRKVWWGAK